MKKLSSFLLMYAAVALLGSQTMADSVDITAHFTGSGISAIQSSEHEDIEPFKGWAMVTLYNDTADEYFTGIQFSIFSVPTGSAIDHVFFIDEDTLVTPSVAYPPTSDMGIASYTITAPTSTTGAEMLVNFATSLAPGQSGLVKVYTDNRLDKKRFGVSYYPIAIPEPATLALLGIGISLFVSRRRK